jgi:RNA polymerase sigma factor (sigma-70 family)
MTMARPIPPFKAFMQEHRTVVYRFLLASVGPADADDVFQETFLAALRAFPRLRDASNLRGWVLAIATRKAIDAGRARGRRAVPVADPAEAGSNVTVAAAVSAGPPPGADGALPFDPKDPLWLALRALPARQRAAVVHRVVLDGSYAAVAEAMNCSPEAARANVYQGLKKLREELGAT